jgi:hypothetical protein
MAVKLPTADTSVRCNIHLPVVLLHCCCCYCRSPLSGSICHWPAPTHSWAPGDVCTSVVCIYVCARVHECVMHLHMCVRVSTRASVWCVCVRLPSQSQILQAVLVLMQLKAILMQLKATMDPTCKPDVDMTAQC